MQTWFGPNCRWMNVHWIVPWRVDVFLEGAPDLKSMMTVIIWQYLTKDHITYIYVDHMNHLKRNLVWIFIGWSSAKNIFFGRQKIKETYLSFTLDYVENKQINVFFLNPNRAWKINGFGADDIEVDLLLS